MTVLGGKKAPPSRREDFSLLSWCRFLFFILFYFILSTQNEVVFYFSVACRFLI